MPRLSATAVIFFCAALLALPAMGVPQIVEIPFTFTDGFIRLEVRVSQNAQPLSLLLDSGAGASVLSLRAAQRLGLPLGQVQNVRGVGVDVTARQLSGVQASVDGFVLSDIPLAIDLSAAEQLCSQPVDGLIGISFFQDRVVQIDYVHHKLRVASSAKPSAAAVRLPAKDFNGTLCIPIGVNGSAVRWARFDTGCNDALHWVIPRATKHADHNAISIGFITDDDDTSLTSVSLGKRTLHPVKTSLHSTPLFPGEAGLVGNELLSQFTVTVDWPRHQVLLEDAPRQ